MGLFDHARRAGGSNQTDIFYIFFKETMLQLYLKKTTFTDKHKVYR